MFSSLKMQKRQQIPPSAQEIVVYRGLTEGEPENRNVSGLALKRRKNNIFKRPQDYFKKYEENT